MSKLKVESYTAFNQKSLDEILENAWLGLGDTSSIEVDNILNRKTVEEIENPHIHLINVLRNPDNFFFTCKHVLNKTLLPFQLAILRELWIRPFPMLVGSRGMGKSFLLALYVMLRGLLCQGSKIVIVGAAFRQAKYVFEYCEEIWNNAPILRDIVGDNHRNGPRRDIDRCTLRMGDSLITVLPLGDGTKIRGQRGNIIIADEFACLEKDTLVETNKGLVRIGDCENDLQNIKLIREDGVFVEPDKYIRTPPTDAYRITTKFGYEFVCSSIHQVQTTKGWKLARELTTDDYLIHQSSTYFPETQVELGGIVVDENIGWLFGTLVAEGSVANKYTMAVKSTDIHTVNRVGACFAAVSDNTIGYSTLPAYQDKRGWNCKEAYDVHLCDLDLRNQFEELGLVRTVAEFKRIPNCILKSPKKVVLAFLSGLFDGDGSAFLWTDRGREGQLGIAYYTSSERLAKDVQQVLHKLGVVCSRKSRKSKLSNKPQWMLRLNGKYAHLLASMLNIPKWEKVIRAARKPYSPPRNGVIYQKHNKRWKAEVRRDGKACFLGSFLTEEEARKCVDANRPVPHLKIKNVKKLDGKQVLYDFHIPDGHQFLGGCFVQHNSISVEIFENVVSGFAAVTLSPIDKVRMAARRKALQQLNILPQQEDTPAIPGLNSNQTILSGTAYYGFNHFCDYWKRWKAIIESKGDIEKLQEIFHGEIPEKFNWKDYSVTRIPVKLLPDDFMDAKHVAKARATIHLSQYLMEYGAVFSIDSNGFFKRTLIESCVVGKSNYPIILPSSGEIRFSAALRGNPKFRYVMAIDPASENDNFSIVILELHDDHRRIVHCWTTTRSRFKAKLKKGYIREDNFYEYAARKIRDLLVLFPCERIALDTQGGGVAVTEALGSSKNLLVGERPILPVIVEGEEKDTDRMPGNHLIEHINFASAEWVSWANHGLKKDFEDKVTLFPAMDSVELSLAYEEDKQVGRVKINNMVEEKIQDTLEDCVLEIEELKDELATIVMTQTGTSKRDRWDTPETKLAGGKKGRLRKDRYTSLLMANAIARTIQLSPTAQRYASSAGGFAHDLVQDKKIGGEYTNHQNPDWYTQVVMSSDYGALARRQ